MPLTKLSLKQERNDPFVYHKYFVNGVARARALALQPIGRAGAPAWRSVAANCVYSVLSVESTTVYTEATAGIDALNVQEPWLAGTYVEIECNSRSSLHTDPPTNTVFLASPGDQQPFFSHRGLGRWLSDGLGKGTCVYVRKPYTNTGSEIRAHAPTQKMQVGRLQPGFVNGSILSLPVHVCVPARISSTTVVSRRLRASTTQSVRLIAGIMVIHVHNILVCITRYERPVPLSLSMRILLRNYTSIHPPIGRTDSWRNVNYFRIILAYITRTCAYRYIVVQPRSIQS